MAIDARLRLGLRRNEARAYRVRVIGMTAGALIAAAPRMQIRDSEDAAGPALVNLQLVADAAQGLRVEALDLVEGVPSAMLTIQISKQTATDPAIFEYGALGEPVVFAYGLQWSGRTRLYGDLVVQGSPIDSELAPEDRPAAVVTDSPVSLDAGATVILSADEVIELVIDGAGEVAAIGAAGQAVVAQASAEAGKAAVSAAATQTLFDTAQAVLPKRTGPEANGGKALRLLWGIRELGSWKAGVGMIFQKLMLRSAETRMDDSTLMPLLKDRIGVPTGPEVGTFQRLVVGGRLFYDVTVGRGFYPRRLTIPAAAQIDDDLSTGIAQRLSGVVNGGASGPDICCSGDSLTAATYPTVLAQLTGRTVRNHGVGGETSRTIGGRMGVWPMIATVAGGAIPAAGAVGVSLKSVDGGNVSPLKQHGADGRSINPCVIAGVVGVLSLVSSDYFFTRSSAGEAVPVPFPAAIVTDAYRTRAGDIHVMEWGQNDGVNDAIDIIARQRSLIDWMDRSKKRWLVSGLSTSTAGFRAPMEAQFLAAYGRRFVNIREYLSSPAAMAHAGLTPTAQDTTDMTNGKVPESLRSDDTHLNAAGYAEKAYFIFLRLKEMEWL